MKRNKSNISRYVNRFNGLSRITKKINKVNSARRGGIKL